MDLMNLKANSHDARMLIARVDFEVEVQHGFDFERNFRTVGVENHFRLGHNEKCPEDGNVSEIAAAQVEQVSDLRERRHDLERNLLKHAKGISLPVFTIASHR